VTSFSAKTLASVLERFNEPSFLPGPPRNKPDVFRNDTLHG
jgi:hypothetical protein